MALFDKKEHLEKIVDARGFLRGLAIDQRGSLKKMMYAALGREATLQEFRLFKSTIVRSLSPYVTAVLIDQEYGADVLRSSEHRPSVILPYEKSGYDVTDARRMPDLLPGYSVARLRDEGAQAVKILVYYDCDDSETNEEKQAFVKKVGDECARDTMPFLLEIVSYSKDEKNDAHGFAQDKPRRVAAAAREFSKTKYSVDISKLEFPVSFGSLESEGVSSRETAYNKETALECIRTVDQATGKTPYIYLSGGVPMEIFLEELALAREAGAHYSGVLSGRATWQEGVKAFAQGTHALEEWCVTEGANNVMHVNTELDRGAKSIFSRIS